MQISTVQYMRIYRFETGTLIDLLSTFMVKYVKGKPPVNIKIFRLIERLKFHVECKGRREVLEI